MQKNEKLGVYDIRHNTFEDEGVKFLTEVIPETKWVYSIEISERVSKEALEEFKLKLTENKPKKGRKGKKGKGKKKKK